MNLPPVLQIAIDEDLWTESSPTTLKEVIDRRGLLSELNTQANWSIEGFHFADSIDQLEPGAFRVAPSGALNPFSPVGKCRSTTCRTQTTSDFVRTVGLYSDFALIPDPITPYFVEEALLDDDDYESLLNQLYVIKKLIPLIKAGVLRFGNPSRRYCADCHARLNETLSGATDALVSQAVDYRIELIKREHEPFMLLNVPMLYPDQDHPLLAIVRLQESEAAKLGRITSSGQPRTKAGRELMREIISKDLKRNVRSVFFELDTARKTKSLLLAGSRAETLVINQLDRSAAALTHIEDWETVRSVQLPWVSELTIEEVLMLREEANKALPRLRELLRERLNEPSAGTSTRVDSAVAELRSQALEVQAELDSLNLPRERNYRIGMAGLAMSFVIYGIASEVPGVVATSLAALLATFAHLRNTERELDREKLKLVATPGYVLLKAKQILQTRDPG